MFKKVLTLVALFMLAGTLSACNIGNTNAAEAKGNNSQGIDVVVSFNPLKEFAEAIGKDKINVRVIVPPGTEAHEFEPKPKDMANINNAEIFVYNGVGMEAWVDNTLEVMDNKNLVVVEASKGADLIKTEAASEHGGYDPHLWLSLKEAKVQARNIKDALVKVDSANKDFYENNYEAYAKSLDDLYNEYKTKFDSIANKNFVTGHAAFAYLCRDFGLVQNSVEDVFSEGDPTLKRMEQLVEFSRNNNIKTIFMEELASPKVSETLGKEVGAKVEKIYTIESKEDNKDYIQSMRDNLENIYNSLK